MPNWLGGNILRRVIRRVTPRLKRRWNKHSNGKQLVTRQINNLQWNHLSNKCLVLESLADRTLRHAYVWTSIVSG